MIRTSSRTIPMVPASTPGRIASAVFSSFASPPILRRQKAQDIMTCQSSG